MKSHPLDTAASPSPDSPPVSSDDEPHNKVPLNTLDYMCRKGWVRILVLITGLILLYPHLMTCCRPSSMTILFFFLFSAWLFFSEQYAFYYHTFKRRDLYQLSFTILLLPMEYFLYSGASSLMGYVLR